MSAMHDLIELNRRRRTIRKWASLGAILPALVALLLVVKLLSMYVFAHQSIRSFVSMNFAQSVSMSEWQGHLNWFEPYKADFNLGSALAELGELEDARESLERALSRAPQFESCAVRYNLATVVERQGDRETAAGNEAAGQELYVEALGILEAAYEGCFDDLADEHSPDTARSMPESLKVLAQRILEKLKQDQPESQQQNPNDGEGDGDGESDEEREGEAPPEGPDESQLDDLKQQLQDGAQERQEREQGQSGGSGGSGGGTDRPW